MTPTPGLDVDNLPPTQLLILEVLAARHRLGERLWPFPSRLQRPIDSLERAGLVSQMSGSVERSVRVSLTDAGVAAMLHGPYVSPVHEPLEKVRLIATAAKAAGTVLWPAQVLAALGEAS